jgi:hypothetical protein
MVSASNIKHWNEWAADEGSLIKGKKYKLQGFKRTNAGDFNFYQTQKQVIPLFESWLYCIYDYMDIVYNQKTGTLSKFANNFRLVAGTCYDACKERQVPLIWCTNKN